MTIFEKVQEIIAAQMRIEKDSIRLDSTIKTEVKADSLDVAEIMFTVEDEFGIEISTEKARTLVTIGQFVDLIDELIKAK